MDWPLSGRTVFGLFILVVLVGMIVAVVYGGIQAVRGPQEPGTEGAPDKEVPGGRIEWRSDSMQSDRVPDRDNVRVGRPHIGCLIIFLMFLVALAALAIWAANYEGGCLIDGPACGVRPP